MLILKKYAIRAFIFAAILLVFVVGQARAQGEATSDQSNCNGAGQVRVDGVCRQVYTAVQQRDVFVPSRIKVGEGASAYYLDPTTDNSNWENCVSGIGTQDSTCVVPYRYGVAAGLATITADFTRANPVVGGAGTALRWTTTNAVSLNVTCTGVATYGPAAIPLQGNPSGITLNSATAGTVNCVYVARNSDNEPTTVTASVTFANPVPPTVTASFTNPNPWYGVDTTRATWGTTNASSLRVACTGASWNSNNLLLQSGSSNVSFNASTSGPGTISCLFTATNEIGQTAQTTATATFAVVPAPTANLWFSPASIKEGESSSVNWSTTNAVYAGIVCSGVEINYAGVTTPNQTWYWNPITFPTAGQQQCGIRSINAAGVQVFTNATLYIYAASQSLGGSPANSTTTESNGFACNDCGYTASLGENGEGAGEGSGTGGTGSGTGGDGSGSAGGTGD